MAPLAAFSSFLILLVLSFPAVGQWSGKATAGAVTPVQYQDPSLRLHQWFQPQPRGYHSNRQQQYHAYQQRRMEQERRWRAHQQQQLEAQRRWYEQQRRLYNEWQQRAYGHPPRRLDPLREHRQPPRQASPERRDGGGRPDIDPVAPDIVAFANSEEPGTIIIDTDARMLYFTISSSEAYAYPVSVGREGFGWHGTEAVSRVASWPNWHPPEEMRQRQPELPKMMTGGINNPLGARAIYLGDTLYRIHGTNEESSIGQAASSGCFRMRNEHVVHLADMIEVGTMVRVVERWPDGGMARAGEPG